MNAVAEIITLLIGFIVWFLLRPYIGLGGLLVGVVVAYVSRPLVYALLGASVGGADLQKRREIEAPQLESSPSGDNEQKEENQDGT